MAATAFPKNQVPISKEINFAGGGQPYGVTDDLRVLRAKGLYKEDEHAQIRCSHQNPAIKKLYADFLGAPLSEKAHHLLHTHYTKRNKYQK